MLSWRNNGIRVALPATLIAVSAAYPVMVFVADKQVTPLAFAAGACVLLATRAFLGARQHWSRELRGPLLVAIALIAGLGLLDGALAARAYPVVVSGGLALLFGMSLWQPRSLVERFAELSGDVLSPAGRRYCRRVTLVWAIWLAINTAVSGVLALAGSLAAWTLWTGVIAYVVSGIIFGSEFVLRRMLRRRHAA
jgi:uncharacterized membrane protein